MYWARETAEFRTCLSNVSRWSTAHPHNSLSLSLSLRYNGHFPGEPGLPGVYWSKGWWRWCWQLDHWSYKLCKTPVKSSPPTNQHPVFLQAGCPSCRPTNSVKALKGKYHIPWTCLPQAHLGAFQLCLWPLIAPGYLGGRVAMPLISPLMPVPQHIHITITYMRANDISKELAVWTTG